MQVAAELILGNLQISVIYADRFIHHSPSWQAGSSLISVRARFSGRVLSYFEQDVKPPTQFTPQNNEMFMVSGRTVLIGEYCWR